LWSDVFGTFAILLQFKVPGPSDHKTLDHAPYGRRAPPIDHHFCSSWPLVS
jgi:hypothetical protein